MTPEQKQAAASLRALGHGDRKIAEKLGLSVWSVRKARQLDEASSVVSPPSDGPAILLYDIETAPALVWVWSNWQTNVIATERDWYMLSFAYRWHGTDETHFISIFQDPDFEPDTSNDRFVAERLADLFDQADATIAHNGDSFDVKKANARFLSHRISPPSPYLQIDTKREYNRYFKDYSASLNEIARRHGFGAKITHTGFDLWRRCMAGDPEAWALMEEYNRHDVFLLGETYELLRPWIGSPGKPGGINLSLWHKGEVVCKHCASPNVIKRGWHRSGVSEFQTLQCKDCGGYSRGRKREPQPEGGPLTV